MTDGPNPEEMTVLEILNYASQCWENFFSIISEACAMSGLFPDHEVKAKIAYAKSFLDEVGRVWPVLGRPEVLDRLFGDDDADPCFSEKVEEFLLKVESEEPTLLEYKH